MKLLLCSEGFHTPELVDACARLVGKPKADISIGVINEAYAVETGDMRWVLTNLHSAADNFGGEFLLVNLLALDRNEIRERLESVDVIYVVGGHTDWLMHVLNESGLAAMLPDLLKSKVYVGSSAGSMVVGRRISTAAYAEVYGEEGDYGITQYLNLVDLAPKPHLGSDMFPYNRPDVLDRVTADFTYPVYGLRDDSALVVEGDQITTIGSEPYLKEAK
jgi:dipeptidase E